MQKVYEVWSKASAIRGEAIIRIDTCIIRGTADIFQKKLIEGLEVGKFRNIGDGARIVRIQ